MTPALATVTVLCAPVTLRTGHSPVKESVLAAPVTLTTLPPQSYVPLRWAPVMAVGAWPAAFGVDAAGLGAVASFGEPPSPPGFWQALSPRTATAVTAALSRVVRRTETPSMTN